MKFFRFAAPALLGLALSPVAQAATVQSETPEVVVKAPSGLAEKEQKRWDEMNRDAQKLEKKMAKLEKQVEKDEKEARRAEKKLEDARHDVEDSRDKLKDRREELNDVVKDMMKIQKQRTEMRQGLL